jgi:hypothetical protein
VGNSGRGFASGLINASTWDFAAHISLYCFGAGAYAMNLCLLLERRPEFSRMLLWAVIAGGLCSAWSGLNQYFTGFENTRDFIYQQEIKSGEKIVTGQFATRLSESRVSADFTICNTYADIFAAVFPVIIAMFWTLGGKVTPPLLSRIILSVPFAALFLFLLKETGSRGGILAIGRRTDNRRACAENAEETADNVACGNTDHDRRIHNDGEDGARLQVDGVPLRLFRFRRAHDVPRTADRCRLWGFLPRIHMDKASCEHGITAFPAQFHPFARVTVRSAGLHIASAVILLPVAAGLFILYRIFRQEKKDFEV